MFTGVGLNIDSHMGGIVAKDGKAVRLLDASARNNIKTENSIDVLHAALNLWSEQRRDEMRELLVSEGAAGDAKFDKLCQAIIEAGTASVAHPETNEKRILEAFRGGTSQDMRGARAENMDAFV